jgi:hypothetical protein
MTDTQGNIIPDMPLEDIYGEEVGLTRSEIDAAAAQEAAALRQGSSVLTPLDPQGRGPSTGIVSGRAIGKDEQELRLGLMGVDPTVTQRDVGVGAPPGVTGVPDPVLTDAQRLRERDYAEIEQANPNLPGSLADINPFGRAPYMAETRGQPSVPKQYMEDPRIIHLALRLRAGEIEPDIAQSRIRKIFYDIDQENPGIQIFPLAYQPNPLQRLRLQRAAQDRILSEFAPEPGQEEYVRDIQKTESGLGPTPEQPVPGTPPSVTGDQKETGYPGGTGQPTRTTQQRSEEDMLFGGDAAPTTPTETTSGPLSKNEISGFIDEIFETGQMPAGALRFDEETGEPTQQTSVLQSIWQLISDQPMRERLADLEEAQIRGEFIPEEGDPVQTEQRRAAMERERLEREALRGGVLDEAGTFVPTAQRRATEEREWRERQAMMGGIAGEEGEIVTPTEQRRAAKAEEAIRQRMADIQEAELMGRKVTEEGEVLTEERRQAMLAEGMRERQFTEETRVARAQEEFREDELEQRATEAQNAYDLTKRRNDIAASELAAAGVESRGELSQRKEEAQRANDNARRELALAEDQLKEQKRATQAAERLERVRLMGQDVSVPGEPILSEQRLSSLSQEYFQGYDLRQRQQDNADALTLANNNLAAAEEELEEATKSKFTRQGDLIPPDAADEEASAALQQKADDARQEFERAEKRAALSVEESELQQFLAGASYEESVEARNDIADLARQRMEIEQEALTQAGDQATDELTQRATEASNQYEMANLQATQATQELELRQQLGITDQVVQREILTQQAREAEFERELQRDRFDAETDIQQQRVTLEGEIAERQSELQASQQAIQMLTTQMNQMTQMFQSALANPAAYGALGALGGGGPSFPGLEALGFNIPAGAAPGRPTPAPSFFGGQQPTLGALGQIDPQAMEYLNAILGFTGTTPQQFGRTAAGVTPGMQALPTGRVARGRARRIR